MNRSEEARRVEAAQAGDLAAFESLVHPYEGRIYQLLLRMLRTEEDARDVLQETLFKAFEKIGTFRGGSAFGTWLHRIGVTQALMWLRKRGADPLQKTEELDRPRFNWMGAHAERIDDWSESAEARAGRGELREILNEALSSLPELDRAVVLLKDAEGASHQEIAEATGLSPLAARTRLHRARLALRQKLTRRFRENDEARLDDDVQGRGGRLARLFGR